MTTVATREAWLPAPTFHCRFPDLGRAVPPTRREREEPKYTLLVITGVNTSGVVGAYGASAWLQALGASTERPIIELKADPTCNLLAVRWYGHPDAARRPTRPEARGGEIEAWPEPVYSLAKVNDWGSAAVRVFDFIGRQKMVEVKEEGQPGDEPRPQPEFVWSRSLFRARKAAQEFSEDTHADY
jgi:hypothetical protein